MSIEQWLDHTCDIYHVIRTDVSPGYNLPGSPSFSYPNTPDLSEIACHFNVHGDSTSMVQNEPNNDLAERTKLNLPVGTDVRLNDRVIDTSAGSAGLEYTVVSPPRNIRGNHMIVYVERTKKQKPL